MKQIGKGSFTTAYLKPDGKVLLKSIDEVKEAMAQGFFPNHRLFPKVELVDRGDKFNYYEMKYFERTNGLKSHLTLREWELYKLLCSLFKSRGYLANIYDGYSRWYEIFERIPNKFKEEREALIEALNGLSNYFTDIGFEISPRNVAVEGGKLILLDCFFQMSKLKHF